MTEHGPLGGLGIARFEGREDALVIPHREANAIVIAHEIAAMRVGMGVGLCCEACEHRIAGGLEDGEVKSAVRDLEAHGIVGHAVLRLDQAFQVVERPLIDLRGGAAGEVGLQQTPCLDHRGIAQVGELPEIEAPALIDGHRALPDSRSGAVADFENAPFGQELKGAAQTVPAHTEQTSEIALGWQLVARLQEAGCDQVGEAARDLLAQRLPANAVAKGRADQILCLRCCRACQIDPLE